MANYTTTGSDTFPAGHVVRTSVVYDQDVAGHIVTSASSPTATGVLISTPAVSGSNYNRITWSGSSYYTAGVYSPFYLFCSKNGGAYALCNGNDGQSYGNKFYYSGHKQTAATWVDSRSLTSGTNIYQIYFETPSASFYLVHTGNDYSLTVQEVQV